MPRVSRLCTYGRQSRHFSIHAASFNLSLLRLSTESGSLHKVFSLPPWKPSLQPVPGIPEPTLAIENVKNEKKAEEGETSAVTGRVLSLGADIAQSLKEAAARNGCGHSELVIKTPHSNNPQFILF